MKGLSDVLVLVLVLVLRNQEPDLSRLFTTGEYADFTVICKDRTWNVHRNIVLPRCEFFKACLQGEFVVRKRIYESIKDGL